MAKQSFYQWVRKQVNRDDRVGDLARDAVQDPAFPKYAKQHHSIREYLSLNHDPPRKVFLTLLQAFCEYDPEFKAHLQWLSQQVGKRDDDPEYEAFQAKFLFASPPLVSSSQTPSESESHSSSDGKCLYARHGRDPSS